MIPPLYGLAFIKDPLVIFTVGISLLVLFIWYFATESDRRKRNIGSILTLGVIALCVASLLPLGKTLKGGIDIVGGSSFTLKVQPNIDTTNGEVIPVSREALDQAIEIIRNRLNAIGTTDMLIATTGTDTIIVQMPGMGEEASAEVKKQLEKVAKLELREVSRESMRLGKAVFDGDEVVPGYRAYKHEGTTNDGEPYTEYLLLSTRPAITGADVANAWPTQNGASIDVAIRLTGDGGDKMAALTGPMQPGQDRIAVLLDDEVITAPVVQSVPLGQNFVIQGQKNLEEASKLASQLMNPLENALKIENSSQVTPSLGAAVVKQGAISGLLSLAFTAIFIFIYYRMAGVVALVALLVNALITFGAMAIIGASFTLPGIAGIILTIGMAVDANVLIYERLREELENGKSFATAIETAYAKAFSAIFDSNITSLLTAIILFWKATDTVKGFAVTLTIGLLGSMFSAILVTRVIFRWAIDFGMLKKVTLMNFFRRTNFDFLSKYRLTFALSGLVIAASIAAFVVKGDRAYGVDFTGGSLIRYQFPVGDQGIRQGEAQEALKDLDTVATPIFQEERPPASGEMLTIRCDSADADKIQEAMKEAFPALKETVPVLDAEGKDSGKTEPKVGTSVDSVSATAGKAFLINSAIALALGLVLILIYISIRFEFSFALGAFAAIIHDLIISVGVVILLGGELQLIHVGAILTIAGYSINDTIIVFDRVRESLLMRTGTVKELINEAINATLSRTLLTSLTTVFAVIILSIFGGSGLRAFSEMILIGLIVGTYSSIFIASPIVLLYSRNKNLRKEVMDTELAGETAAKA
jgi:SecD/SecF fusion protein